MITTTTTAAAKQQQRRASAAAVGEDATAAAEGSWSMLMGSPTKRSSYSPQAARGRDAAEEEEVVAPPPNWCGTQTDWPLARSFFVLYLLVTFLEFAPSLSGRENIIMVVQIPTSSQMSAHQEALFVCGCRAAAARWLAQAHTHRKAVRPTY